MRRVYFKNKYKKIQTITAGESQNLLKILENFDITDKDPNY